MGATSACSAHLTARVVLAEEGRGGPGAAVAGAALAVQGRREERGCPATMGVPLQQQPAVLGSPGKKRGNTSQRKGFCFQCVSQLLVAAAKNTDFISAAKRNSVQGSLFSIPV